MSMVAAGHPAKRKLIERLRSTFMELSEAEETVADRMLKRANAKKPTNPKDALSVDRIPMHLFPRSAVLYGAMAFHEGQLKYDSYNWREAGVRASVYTSALMRHMDAWWDGEDIDPGSGLPHLAKAIACIAILIDASKTPDMFVDDRPPPGAFADLLKEFTPMVAELRDKVESEHEDR